MRLMIAAVLWWGSWAQAQDPAFFRLQVPDAEWILRTDACAGTAKRALRVQAPQAQWGCWGFDRSGITVVWQDGVTQHESWPTDTACDLACPVPPLAGWHYDRFATVFWHRLAKQLDN